jgi:lysophospholipase L1-like esterase
MKVVILADSLAMARPESEGDIRDDATYPSLLDRSLRRKFGASAPILIERGTRRRTIELVLADWPELVELKSAEVVIVHVGIVDCAPRVFMRLEHDLVNRLRPKALRDAILRFVHKHRRSIIRMRPRVYVPPERFRRHVQEVIELARTSAVQSLVFVNILSPPPELETRSPGFQKNVSVYNQILEESVRGERLSLIDLDRMIREAGGTEKLTIDGIHINEEGHALLARSLEEHVLNFIAKRADLLAGVPAGGAF